MRRLIATIAATLALAGFGLATQTASSDGPDDTSDAASYLLPYIEQENVYRQFNF